MKHEVGAIVELKEKEREELSSRQMGIDELQQELGTLREEYIEKDAQLCARLKERRKAYHGAMVSAAAICKVDFSSEDVVWKWHPDRLVFERLK